MIVKFPKMFHYTISCENGMIRVFDMSIYSPSRLLDDFRDEVVDFVAIK